MVGRMEGLGRNYAEYILEYRDPLNKPPQDVWYDHPTSTIITVDVAYIPAEVALQLVKEAKQQMEEARMHASDPSVFLGGWHRENDCERVLAIFVIDAPKGVRYTAHNSVEPCKEFGVVFPHEFAAHFEEGIYSWHCEIAAKTVMSGRFEWRRTENGTSLKMLKP